MKVLKWFGKYAYAWWLGAGISALGYGFKQWEYWAFCIPLIMLVRLAVEIEKEAHK